MNDEKKRSIPPLSNTCCPPLKKQLMMMMSDPSISTNTIENVAQLEDEPESPNDELWKYVMEFQKSAIWAQMNQYKALANEREKEIIKYELLIKNHFNEHSRDNISDDKIHNFITDFEKEFKRLIYDYQNSIGNLEKKLNKSMLRCSKLNSISSDAVEKTISNQSTPSSAETILDAKQKLDIRKLELLESETNNLKTLNESYLRELADLKKMQVNHEMEIAELKAKNEIELKEHSSSELSVRLANSKSYVDETERWASALEKQLNDTMNSYNSQISSLEGELIDAKKVAENSKKEFETSLCRIRAERDSLRSQLEAAENRLERNAIILAEYQKTIETLKLESKANFIEIQRLRKSVEGTANDNEATLLEEIETIGKAYEEAEANGARLSKLVEEKERILTHLTADKLKFEASFLSAARERDMYKNQVSEISSSIKTPSNENESMKYKQIIRTLETEKVQIESVAENLKLKLKESQIQLSELKSHYDKIGTRYSEANSLLKDKTQRLEMETLSAKQLSDEVKILKNKLLIFEKYDKSGNSEELEVYKRLLKCASCNRNEKNAIISKCMHPFCRECLDARIETRQRKCPNCGEPFGANDIKPLYL